MADKNSQWKQKYYDSLDDIEDREKKWQSLEDLFKQAISRLTLAAEGNSRNLDSSLGELRTAIRKGKDNQIIRSILDGVSKEILKLDTMAKAGPKGEAGFLFKIIEQMHLTGKSEKKSRKLLKSLKAKNPPEQSELLKSFTALLSDVVEQAVLDNENVSGNNKSSNGGFLKNLFSSGKEETLSKKSSPDNELNVEEEVLGSPNLSTDDVFSAEKESSAGKEASAHQQEKSNQKTVIRLLKLTRSSPVRQKKKNLMHCLKQKTRFKKSKISLSIRNN